MRGLENKKSINRSISGNGGALGLLASRVLRPWSVVKVLLRLNLVLFSSDTSYHTSDAVLELAVLGGIDDRIDTYVGELHHDAEVVEPVYLLKFLVKKNQKCT